MEEERPSLGEMLVRAINKEFDVNAKTFPEAVKKAKKKKS